MGKETELIGLTYDGETTPQVSQRASASSYHLIMFSFAKKTAR